MQDVSIAFIGISHPHSSGRFRALGSLDGVHLVGAWDPDPEAQKAFCEEVGTVPIGLEQALSDPEVHAVAVHSKSKDMLSLTRQGLMAGKAVLVEKPGGANLADLEELARLEATRPWPIRVGYNFHFAPAMDQVREILGRGSIGRISVCSAHGASSHGEHLSAHLNQPADMGGALWVIGCHVLHLVIEVLGVPASVQATVRKLHSWSGPQSREDVASVTLNYPDRIAVFSFTVHDSMEWFETSQVTLYGEDGTIRFGVLPGQVEMYTSRATLGQPAGWHSWDEGRFVTPWTGTSSPFTELLQIGNITFFAREAEEFVQAIRGERTNGGVTPTMAWHIAQVIDAAYRSSEIGGLAVRVGADLSC